MASTAKSTSARKSATSGAKGRSLVIVESPAKAKTINKYLGSNFIVKSSVGHVRDLPTGASKNSEKKPATRKKLTPEEKALKAQSALVNRMGVDPENDWIAHYEVLPGKENVVADLKKLAKDAVIAPKGGRTTEVKEGQEKVRFNYY